MAKADFTVRLVPDHLVRIPRFRKSIPKQTRRGLIKAGAILEREFKHMVGGPGFTRNPGRSSDFIGVNQGRLRGSITSQLDSDGETVRIGPDVKYAIFHQIGTKHIPARPMLEPLWKRKGAKALDVLHREMMAKL